MCLLGSLLTRVRLFREGEDTSPCSGSCENGGQIPDIDNEEDEKYFEAGVGLGFGDRPQGAGRWQKCECLLSILVYNI